MNKAQMRILEHELDMFKWSNTFEEMNNQRLSFKKKVKVVNELQKKLYDEKRKNDALECRIMILYV